VIALLGSYLGVLVEPPSPGLDATLLQYGAIGAIALGGMWFGLGAYRREVRRSDALAAELSKLRDDHAAELRALNAEIRDKQVPVLSEAVRVLGDVTVLMRERR
jgi:hypothetical protein